MRWYFLLLRHGMRFDGHGGERYLFQPFVGIGLVPDGGATWLLPSFVGAKRAYELMAFGEKLGAEKAVEWGLG